MFYPKSFDDIMKFEYFKLTLIFSRAKRAFEVSQKLSFRLKKQTSKNVADTTLKACKFN